jgi:hypothetical protein
MIHAASILPGVTAYTQSFQSVALANAGRGSTDWPARWTVGDPGPALVAAGLGDASRGLSVDQHTERVLNALLGQGESAA